MSKDKLCTSRETIKEEMRQKKRKYVAGETLLMLARLFEEETIKEIQDEVRKEDGDLEEE